MQGAVFAATITFQFNGQSLFGGIGANIILQDVIWLTKPHKNGFFWGD